MLLSAPPETFSPETTRRIVQIQALTLIWMSVKGVVSLGAAWFARSPALLGFGGDSVVELLSATAVLWRFCSPSRGDHAERQAARIAGGLLFVLAAESLHDEFGTRFRLVESLKELHRTPYDTTQQFQYCYCEVE
jgi:hypothetical protein